MNITEIFETMDYGTAPEADTEARAWIAGHHGQFGHFINGSFTKGQDHFETRNPARGEVLAHVAQATETEIDTAISAARKAFGPWSRLSDHARARYLYALARALQKHSRLFAVLETLDNGKPIREARDVDIPLAQRHFYYHAGLAQLRGTVAEDHQPLGVCGQIIPWNFPLLMLAWKIAPALAAGNTVVLKPAEFTPLTALLFAEICQEVGLPKGVVNIITGDGTAGAYLAAHAGIDKLAFTGSTEVGRKIYQARAGSGTKLSLELGGKSPFIIFDDADLDSAVEGLVDAIWFNQGQVCCAGSRLLVQDSVADEVYAKIRARMAKLRVGDPLDKSIDIGAMVDDSQAARVRDMVAGVDAFSPECVLPETGCFLPPMLITDLGTAHPLMQEEIFGPVLVAARFRTPEEAVSLANNTRYGLAASIWSENISLALDIAPKLAAGVVWVNGTNMFDAAAPFGGVRQSGVGREGGVEGLRAYMKAPLPLTKIEKPVRHPAPATPKQANTPAIDRTAKLYIGGKQARPDGGHVIPIWSKSGDMLGQLGRGNRKDIRNAVEAAEAASGWGTMPAHSRAQILYYLAENLAARGQEFAERLCDLTGQSKATAKAEVETSLSRLFSYAAWADKFAGEARAVPLRGLAMALREAVGVIGIIAPQNAPLLGAISLLAPAVAMGNRVVLLPSLEGGLAMTDFYQVLDTSDVPAGVINIVTGDPSEMAADLAAHMALDAIWNFNANIEAHLIDTKASLNLKRSWGLAGFKGKGLDWRNPACEGVVFLEEATEVKTVWVPYGA